MLDTTATTRVQEIRHVIGRAASGNMKIQDIVSESSGYIPRNAKEAQDPRWSSALTVDVHTDTMKKQIAKFFPTAAPKDGQEHVKENISVTGTEKAKIQRKRKIKPGTEEWFKLWFSLPYLTGEQSSRTIRELFEPGKQWEWSFTGSEEAVAVFHVGEIPYQFHAYTYAHEDPTIWEVEFKNATRGQQGRTSKFGLTGTGNSAEVMSTIADIMREFLQRYSGSISQLSFTADEPSRQALYARMVKRLLPDWEIIQSGKNFTISPPADSSQ